MNYTRSLRSTNDSGVSVQNVAEIANNGHHVEFGAIWKPTSTSSASWSIGPVDISWKVDTSSSGVRASGGAGGEDGGFTSSFVFTGTAITAGAAALIGTLAFCLA